MSSIKVKVHEIRLDIISYKAKIQGIKEFDFIPVEENPQLGDEIKFIEYDPVTGRDTGEYRYGKINYVGNNDKIKDGYMIASSVLLAKQ